MIYDIYIQKVFSLVCPMLKRLIHVYMYLKLIDTISSVNSRSDDLVALKSLSAVQLFELILSVWDSAGKTWHSRFLVFSFYRSGAPSVCITK